MRALKHIIALVSVCIAVHCSGQSIKITIYNTTGYDVDSLSLQSTFIGHIKKDDSLTIQYSHELHIEDGAPYFPVASGVVKGKAKDAKRMWGFCGTGAMYVDSGEYKFDLTFHDSETGYTLWWAPHFVGNNN